MSTLRFRKSRQIFLTAFLGLIALISIMPLFLVVSISLSSEKSIGEYGYRFLPAEISSEAYRYLLTKSSEILRAGSISIIVTAAGTLLGISLISLYAYALSNQHLLFRKFFTFYIFFTMLFSGGLVPTYLVMTKILHLQDTVPALIVPLAFNAFYVIVLRTFFQTIPASIVESGRMDGAGEWTILFRMILPMAVPGIATVALFSAVAYWNDWFQALLYIRNARLVPLQSYLQRILQNIEFFTSSASVSASQTASAIIKLPAESARMAMVVLTIVPIFVSYPFFQRFFISGLTVGALKE